MNVECPSCATRYSVDDARIPPPGVTIKCPKCQHVFVAKRQVGTAEAPTIALPGTAGSVALPGTAATGSRGSPVPLPGTRPLQAATPATPAGKAPVPNPVPNRVPNPAPKEADELDLGLNFGTEDFSFPTESGGSTASIAPPSGGLGDGVLDFIDDVAEQAKAAGPVAPSSELRVRRRNGRIEGPFGIHRLVSMIRNKEFNGGEDISEDGLAWRSMTSNPELNRVLNDLASSIDDGLSFGNIELSTGSSDLPASAPSISTSIPPASADLPAPLPPRDLPAAKGRPAIKEVTRGQPANSSPNADGPELASPLDDIAAQSMSFGSSDLATGRRPAPPKMSPAPGPGPGPGPVPSLDDAGKDGLEIGEIPELPPVWRTYRKPILIFAIVIGVVSLGFLTQLWTSGGAFGYKWVLAMFEPPPPPAPAAPPAPPPKLADLQQIASLLDEGSYEAFRSVLATIESSGPNLPDNLLVGAKARGLATLAYGTSAFPAPDLARMIERLKTVDLTQTMGGNAASANLEIAKARGAFDIVNNSAGAAVAPLQAAFEQKSDDKELALLLGLARMRAGDTKGALSALDKAIVIDSGYAPALHAIGDALAADASLGDPKDAALWYVKALNAEPAHSRSAVAAAMIYDRLKLRGERRRVLALGAEKAGRGLPPDQRAEFSYQAAQALIDVGREKEAAPFALEASRLSPASVTYAAAAAVAVAASSTTAPALALINPVLTREPANVNALIARANVYLKGGEVAKAFNDLEAARKASPANKMIAVWEGRFNARLGKYSDARACFQRALLGKEKSPSLAAMIELGGVDLEVGDIDAAFKNASAAVEADPTNPDAHTLLGDCYRLRNQLESAVASYNQALAFDDDDVPAKLGLANALRDMGASMTAPAKVAEAVPIYLSALARDPTNTQVMFEYGRALELQNDLKGAVRLYEEASRLNAKDIGPHLKVVAAFLEAEPPQIEEANRAIERARGIDPSSPHVRFWEGRIAYSKKDYHEAVKFMHVAVQGEPRNALYHFWLGKSQESIDALYEAITSYETAIRLNSRLAAAHRALGWASMQRNQFDAARKAFDLFRETEPNDPSIWVDIGESYERQNQDNEALVAFEKAIRHDPNNVQALMISGSILARNGDEKRATAYFERATKANPQQGDAWCMYGLAVNKTKTRKQRSESVRALKRCLELETSSEDMKANAREALGVN